MAACPFFYEYMVRQRGALAKAVDENKWYLSERAQQDVGKELAARDFCDRHVERFARSFRMEFCRDTCPLCHSCYMGQEAIRLVAAEGNPPLTPTPA